MSKTTNPTVVQTELLKKILESEYHSVPFADRAGSPTWRVATLTTDSERATFVTLEKSGWAGSDCSAKKEEEHTVFVTEDGFKAFTSSKLPAVDAKAPKAPKGKPEAAKTPAPTPAPAKAEKAEKTEKKVKVPSGKTTGGKLGIGEYWLTLFRANETSYSAKKLASVLLDEEITAEMNVKFPGRNSEVFKAVRLVRNRMNAQTCPGVKSWIPSEKNAFHRYVKHEGKIVRATQRGVPCDDAGNPLVKAVEAPAPKATKADEKAGKKAVKVASDAGSKAEKIVAESAKKAKVAKAAKK